MNKLNDDPLERARVYSRIAPVIMMFAGERAGQQFHSDELLHYVRTTMPDIAPDSPSRILRELRLNGQLDYVVLNRRQSLYQFRSRRAFTTVTPVQWERR